LVSGKEGEVAVAKFASDLFGEPDPFEVIFGDVEGIPEPSITRLNRDDYQSLSSALGGTQTAERLVAVAEKLRATIPETDETAKTIGSLLQQDGRTTQLRRLVTGKPSEVKAVAEELFPDLPQEERANGLTDLVALLLRALIP
jgi:hypothetical protein